MQVVLSMFRADGDRRSFSIHKDMTVIGRREDCDLRIPLGEISRKHCRIIKENDTLRVEDLGSSNGTFHNGQRVQEADVQPGDTIQVGKIAFVVQVDGVPADDELQPVVYTAPAGDSNAPAEAESDTNAPADPEASIGMNASGSMPGIGAASGEFDPMAVLGANDSMTDGSMPGNIDVGASHHGDDE